MDISRGYWMLQIINVVFYHFAFISAIYLQFMFMGRDKMTPQIALAMLILINLALLVLYIHTEREIEKIKKRVKKLEKEKNEN